MHDHPVFQTHGFTPLRLLGRGGMGEVWLVERQIAGHSQQLALKLLQSGAGAAQSWLSRFRTEQRIQLELDHPGIARLIDAGETGGQPWIAMEYVDGLDVLAWCDTNKLNIRARLKLFQQICAAVQYAHDRLIVHRDLKPANVLVNTRGEPKLLDFGIAKILDDSDPASRTGTAQQVFSLYGLSPEQLAGQSPTVATDVYALGALLYQLLSGTEALPFEGLSPSAIEQRLLHESPAPPSQRVSEQAATRRDERSAANLTRQLRGDLDRIVLHALRKRSSERYPSVSEFAADIERFLSDQPVLASGQGRLYRSGKFLRRHRYACAATLLITALITAFILQLRLERDAAETARDGAQRVSGFLTTLFELNESTRAVVRVYSAAELLEQGFSQLDAEQLDARSGVEVMLAFAKTANSLGDPRLAESAITALERAETGLQPNERIRVKILATELSMNIENIERSAQLLRELQGFSPSLLSSEQQEKLDFFEIQVDRKFGRAELALQKLRSHAPWSPGMQLKAYRQEALIYLKDRKHGEIEALLAPVSDKLRRNNEEVGSLAGFLRMRASAVAALGNHELANELLTELTALTDARFGPGHRMAYYDKHIAATVRRRLRQDSVSLDMLAELIAAVEPRLQEDHGLLLSAKHNLIVWTPATPGISPAELERARKLALEQLERDYIKNDSVRARFRMALIQIAYLQGERTAALAMVRDYQKQPPWELAGPARQAQLAGWELVLGGRPEADAAEPTRMLERLIVSDELLKRELKNLGAVDTGSAREP